MKVKLKWVCVCFERVANHIVPQGWDFTVTQESSDTSRLTLMGIRCIIVIIIIIIIILLNSVLYNNHTNAHTCTHTHIICPASVSDPENNFNIMHNLVYKINTYKKVKLENLQRECLLLKDFCWKLMKSSQVKEAKISRMILKSYQWWEKDRKKM